MWSRASGEVLLFDEMPSESNASADINVYFAAYDHGDFEQFDGPGGVVAHSAYPMAGQVHFDASEQWTTNDKGRGVDLRYVRFEAAVMKYSEYLSR